MAPRRLLFLLFVPVVLAGCWTRHSSAPAPGAGVAQVQVQNQAFADMDIFIVTSGRNIRLGTVTGNSTRVLDVPASAVGLGQDVVFRADPVGSPASATSYSIFVAPGDRVSLVIPPTVR